VDKHFGEISYLHVLHVFTALFLEAMFSLFLGFILGFIYLFIFFVGGGKHTYIYLVVDFTR
jgi:hypothetical protein